jgi:sporulation protein YlmC with PRC-barrel domain
MESSKKAGFVRLGETNLTVAEPKDDIRGRKVTDHAGDEMGKVKSLFVDEDAKQVRFFEMESGGLFGFGSETRLIPLEAIETVTEDEVRVDAAREHVQRSPIYDPEVTYDERYYGDVYGYYGFAPYWGAGPPYPPHSRDG